MRSLWAHNLKTDWLNVSGTKEQAAPFFTFQLILESEWLPRHQLVMDMTAMKSQKPAVIINLFFTAFAASGVHPILNPPLLSVKARDATGPSLSGGPESSPRRRVCRLGGPELVTPMLLLQLRPSSSSYNEMTGWFHAALALTYWNEMCIVLSQLGAAHEVMVDETKPNSICWNQWISRDCPLANTYPPKRLFQVSSARSPEITKIGLRTISVYVRASNLEFDWETW